MRILCWWFFAGAFVAVLLIQLVIMQVLESQAASGAAPIAQGGESSGWAVSYLFEGIHYGFTLPWAGVIGLAIMGGVLSCSAFMLARLIGLDTQHELEIEALKDEPEEQEDTEISLRAKTFIDEETGLGNRNFFDNRLEAFIKDSSQNAHGVVIFLQCKDLDLIYTENGEAAATALLQELSDMLAPYVNQLEINAIIARRSESDIAFMLPKVDEKQAQQIVTKMKYLCEQIKLPTSVDPECFFHFGLAAFEHGESAYQIFAEADMALRAAQLQGPNGWFMYDKELLADTGIRGAVKWRTLLEDALANRAFVLLFQPTVAADQEVHHYEVLTRLREPCGGLITAGIFLPMAEKCGLTKRIDKLVIEKALKLLAYEQGLHGKSRCSINLHAASVMDKRFLDWMMLFLIRHRSLAIRLIVEISEYKLVSNHKALEMPLKQLKTLGVELLVDQVGQTMHEMEYLEAFNVDYIKLHMSITRDIEQKMENQLYIRGLQSVCDPLGVKIIASGVEKHEEWKTLHQLGLYAGQGFYFTEPLEQVVEVSPN